MRAVTAALGGRANAATETSTDRIPSALRPISRIARKARELWANKVAVELSERTGYSARSAENWLSGHRDMNGDALAKLLRSDAGPQFLAALIADLPPTRAEAWRREFEKAARRAELLDELDRLDARSIGLTA